MLNIKRTISAATAAVILLTGSAMPVQPAVSADTIFAPGMMQNSFGMRMTSFSGGNNYFLLGGSRNGEDRIPVGRQYYSHSETVMKMANDFCTVGSGLFVGNTVFSSSADYQFVFDDFGQSLQFYGDVYHEMTGDLSFSASVSPDTIDRFRMENNGTIPYTAQPYVYIDGMLDVGEDKLEIGTADDVSNVNLICGGLDTYAQIGDGNHVRIRGDVFLTDPEAESVLARTVEIMGMMPEYVQPAAVPWGELHGGSIICNNKSLLVTNPNKEKVIDGDLIMTNPQGKLVVEAPLTVNGRIICAGAIEGTENIQCTEIITPASDVNFFKNYTDPAYGDYKYSSSSYGFPLLPFSFRPDEMFDKYIRWDLQAGTAEDARKLMETDPLYVESADCGHMWDIMEVYAKNRERVEYTGGSDRTVIYYDEDAFEHRNDANVITYKEETCYDDLGNYHYAYAEILIPDSGYANISEEDVVVYVPYTTALSGKAFIQHYEPVTEENLLPEEYQIDDINLFKDLMEGLAGGEVPTISLSEKRVIPVVYHDTNNAEECSESIEAYPVTESCILDFSQNYATVFIDPFRRDYTPDRPMCILLRNMPMDGKIIINNTARYGTDYQSYESLARRGEAAPRRQVLFFLDSTNTNHMEKPCVFCSGAYGQCGNGPTGRGEGDFRIVSNPYYPWTEGWEELPSAFKYAYELVPNAAIFGEAGAEYQMLNYVFFNADILMPSSRISISGNSARSQYIYRSEPESSPRMSQGSYGEALTFLGDVVCNQIDSDRMTVVQLNDAHRSATEVLPPYEAVRGEWENIVWTFDSEGVLTISGEGDMPDAGVVTDIPWNKYRDDI